MNTPPHTNNTTNTVDTSRTASDNSNDISFPTTTALGNSSILSSSSSYLNATSASAAAAQQQHYQSIMTAAYCNDSTSNAQLPFNISNQQTQPQHSMMAPALDNSNRLSSSSSASMTHHMNINPYNYTSDMNTNQYQGINSYQQQSQPQQVHGYDPSVDMQRLLAIQKRELELEAEIQKMEQKMSMCREEGADDNVDTSKHTSTATTSSKKRVSSSDEEEQEPLLTGYAKIVEVERRHSADLLNHGKSKKKKRKIDRRGSGGSGGSSSSVARAA